MIGIRISSRSMIPDGYMALRQGDKVVWYGPANTPIEDAVFDNVLVSPASYQRFATADLNAPDTGAEFIRKVLGPYNPVGAREK